MFLAGGAEVGRAWATVASMRADSTTSTSLCHVGQREMSRARRFAQLLAMTSMLLLLNASVAESSSDNTDAPTRRRASRVVHA